MSSSQPLDALRDLFSSPGQRGLFDNAAVGLNVARLDGSFTEVNDGFCAFLGYTRDELLTLQVRDITHPDDVALTQDYIDDILRQVQRGHVEKRYVRKDGTVVHGLLSASVVRDSEGVPQGLFALVQDITERKRAQSQLAESEQRYKSLFENNYDAVFSLDDEGYFRTANPAAQRICGYSEEELCRMSYVPLVDVNDVPRVRQAFIAALKGEPQNIEMSIVHKEGRRVHLNLTAIPIVVGGRIEGVYGVAHDVTRRRTSERSLEESDERYRAFIENSSEAIWRFELELPIPIDRSEEEQIEHFYRYCYLAECNDAMARMYGFERAEDVIGKRLGEFLSRDNAANIEYLKAFIRSGYRLTDAESQEFDKNANQRYFLNNLIGIVKQRPGATRLGHTARCHRPAACR
jgi:PAS domain S-box-containing protein